MKKPYNLVVENKTIKDIIKFSELFCEIDEFLWTTTRVNCGIYKNRVFTAKCFYNVPLETAEDFFKSCFEDGYKDVKLDIISDTSGFDCVASIIFTNIKE